jgi:acetyl esterase/lipase
MRTASIFILLLLALSINTFSQEPQYTTKLNIPYYPDSISSINDNIKKQCILDVYYPNRTKDFATIIWFHGGGLVSGTKEIPEYLKQKNLCIIAVNYRLNPEVSSPKYIEDAAAAVAWTFNNIGKYGGDTSLIFVSGHSAGGYLACMVGLDKKWLKTYNIDANRIAGLIPFSGQMITHFTIRKERGIKDTQPIIDSLAPLFYVNPNTPPLLLITGDRELEMLGRYEENAYMMRMMKVVGNKRTRLFELQGYGHNMTEPAFPLLLKEVQEVSEEKRLHRQSN